MTRTYPNILPVESEGEEDAGPCEVFGVLRLPLKPGTASGYVGVQRSPQRFQEAAVAGYFEAAGSQAAQRRLLQD